jgi:hypothetical protein
VTLLADGAHALTPAGSVPKAGTLAIPGSFTRDNPTSVEVNGALTLQAVATTASPAMPLAAGISCPLIRLPASGTEWVIEGDPGASLVLDGLFISGGDVRLTGTFDSIWLNCCTLDPGTAAPVRGIGSPPAVFEISADGRPLRPTSLRIEAKVTTLTITRCLLGPIQAAAGGAVETLSVSESIVQATDQHDMALDLADGTASLSRCTVLGPAALHRADISECILHDIATVDDTQYGCVRFSAWTNGSTLPQPYESVRIRRASGLFTSTDFGQPGYAQLLPSADNAILPDPRPAGTPPPSVIGGAADGSEMGAFAREKTPLKLAGLIAKFQEYMPAGLVPVVIPVT